MDNNGFKCYVIYCSVIAYYKNKKYDITKGILPYKRFISPWNKTRFDTDGKLFQILADKFKPSELLKMFVVYNYEHKDKVHPSYIINDNYETWEKVKQQFQYPIETYKHDLVKIKEYCVKHNIKMKELLHSNRIFSLQISVVSFIILNLLFDIVSNLESESELEKRITEKRKRYLDKISNIFQGKLEKYNWKTITQGELKK